MGIIGDALKGLGIGKAIGKVFKGVLRDAEDFFKKIPRGITKGVNAIENEINKIPEKVFDPISDFMSDNIEKPILKLTEGIDEMIENFIRIVCFIKRTPVRFRNLGASFESIFDGFIAEFVALGYALELGYNSISELVYYVAIYLESYLSCIIKILSNFIECAPFYIFDAIGQILYLPIRILLWLFSTFLAIDLYSREKQVWAGLEKLDYELYPYIGFHFIYYPKHIRENCYVCVRLKADAVKRKNKDVHNTFNNEIADVLGRSRDEFKKGFKHFQEVFAYPFVREPRYVK